MIHVTAATMALQKRGPDFQDIYLDDRRVGKSQAGGTFFVDVEPGEHISKVQGMAYTGSTQVTFRIAAGETKYIVTWVGVGGYRGLIDQTIKAPEEAIPHLMRLHYTGKATGQ